MSSNSAPTKTMGIIRRRVVDLSHFNPVRESQVSTEQPLPLVIEPATDQVDLADWARNNREYIAQKLHLHGDGSIALASLTAAAFDIKTESAWRVTSRLRKTLSGLQRVCTTRFTQNMGICPAKAPAARSTPQPHIRKTSAFSITMRARI